MRFKRLVGYDGYEYTEFYSVETMASNAVRDHTNEVTTHTLKNKRKNIVNK